MLVVGPALLAASIVFLWLCLPQKNGELKPFLRGGSDVLAATIIVACFGLGIVATIAGIAQ